MECRSCDVSSWCLFIPKCYTITKKWELLPWSYAITSKFGKIKEISKPFCNEFFLNITFLHLCWDTQIYINKSLLISIEFKLLMQILDEIPRVLIKFWSRRLGCKSRRLGKRVPFSLSSISWKSRRLNTRSSRFFSRPPAVNEIPEFHLKTFSKHSQKFSN